MYNKGITEDYNNDLPTSNQRSKNRYGTDKKPQVFCLFHSSIKLAVRGFFHEVNKQKEKVIDRLCIRL